MKIIVRVYCALVDQIVFMRYPNPGTYIGCHKKEGKLERVKEKKRERHSEMEAIENEEKYCWIHGKLEDNNINVLMG